MIMAILMGTIMFNLPDEADGLKSKGTFGKKFGLATSHIVCGDKLCSDLDNLGESKSSQSLESLIFFECNNDVMCVMNYLEKIGNKDQMKMFAEFNNIISVLGNNTTYCHAQAHHLGGFLFKYTNDLKTSLSLTDSRCGGAVFHGILQAFFEESNLNSIPIDEINPKKICSSVSDIFSQDRYECLHGLGHGLTVFYDYDVFKAVKHCGELVEDWEVDTCSNGVFMENIDSYLSEDQGMFENDNIFYPCNKINPKYAPACYHHQNTFMLVKNNYSISDTFSDCDNIAPQEYVKYCYRGMGRQLAPVSSSIEIPVDPKKNFSQSIGICTKGQTQFQENCLMGMLRVVIDQDSLEKGFAYCKFYPEQFKHNCYSLLGVWIQMIYESSNAQTNQCSQAEDLHYFDVCMNSTFKDWELIQG